MAGGRIGTEIGAMQTAVSQFTSQAGSLETAMGGVTSAVNGLQGIWTGTGNMAFEQAMQEWRTAAQKMHTALTDLTRATQQSGQAFETTDTSIASAFKTFG